MGTQPYSFTDNTIHDCFLYYSRSWAIVTETTWPTKSKIFTICLLTKKKKIVCQSLLGAKLCPFYPTNVFLLKNNSWLTSGSWILKFDHWILDDCAIILPIMKLTYRTHPVIKSRIPNTIPSLNRNGTYSKEILKAQIRFISK